MFFGGDWLLIPINISICVCTFRRPDGLSRALQSLAAVRVLPGFVLEVVVVDNDAAAGSRELVEGFVRSFSYPVRYFCEPTSGVSHARNRCVNEAFGDWVAFIDDDEYVETDWLVALWDASQHGRVDGVFGPVVAEFEQVPPVWLLASGAHQRPRYVTGTAMKWGDCRTGNVLFRRAMFSAQGGFSSSYAATGGEDCEFFGRCLAAGAKLVWCDAAVVHETVPALRMTRRWLLQRAFSGGRNFTRLRAQRRGAWSYGVDAVWGLANVLIYAPLAAGARLFRHPQAFGFERKVAGGLGKFMGLFGRHGGEYAAGNR